MIIIEPTPANKAKITALQDQLAVHAWAAWKAVRDYDCTYVNAPACLDPFEVPADRPTIAIFGDDDGPGTAKGPDGFHRLSLARYLGQCAAVALVTSEAVPSAYSIAAVTAIALQGCTAVVESLPEREAEWLAFIAEAAPRAFLSIYTVEGAGGVH